MEELKRVIVVDASLPLGLIANTTAILGITLGKRFPEDVGPDVADGDGISHKGVIALPIPVLKGDGELIRALRDKLSAPEFSQVYAADFSDVAQGCKTYDEYIGKIAGTPESDLRYLGLVMRGPKKQIAKLTGNLPLLR